MAGELSPEEKIITKQKIGICLNRQRRKATQVLKKKNLFIYEHRFPLRWNYLYRLVLLSQKASNRQKEEGLHVCFWRRRRMRKRKDSMFVFALCLYSDTLVQCHVVNCTHFVFCEFRPSSIVSNPGSHTIAVCLWSEKIEQIWEISEKSVIMHLEKRPKNS